MPKQLEGRENKAHQQKPSKQQFVKREKVFPSNDNVFLMEGKPNRRRMTNKQKPT